MGNFTGYICKYNKTYGGQYQISPGAFDDCDGRIVPIVFNNDHSMEGIIGKATLELRDDGVVANCTFSEVYCKNTYLHTLDNLNNGTFSLGFYAICGRNFPKKDANGIKHYMKGDIRSVSVLPYEFKPDEKESKEENDGYRN